MKLNDLTGLRFGRLTVIGRSDVSTGGRVYWKTICDCGTIKDVSGKCLSGSRTVSCGCKRSEVKHGFAGTRQYKIWAAMHQSCNNPNEESYANYVGRGISVCKV